MPRGFLVKRNSKAVPVSYRSRNADDEGLDDVFKPATIPAETIDTTIDIYAKPFNSPDSGYGHSPGPVAPLAKENLTFRFDKDTTSSPIAVDSLLSTGSYPSPVPFSSSSPPPYERDRFLLTTPTPRTPNNKFNPTAPPPLPGKRPYMERIDRKNKAKKPKAARRLNFDEDEFSKSPVHGTTILRNDFSIGNGRFDESNKKSDEYIVSATDINKDKSKPALGGEYICKLCSEQYSDPLSLAQHKCSRIVHEVYRCPECDKVFNCPANLASHRRWHKPRPNKTSAQQSNSRILPVNNKDSNDSNLQQSDQSSDVNSVLSSLSGSESSRSTPSPGSQRPNTNGHYYHCDQCGKKFRRPANLRKHMQTHVENSSTCSCQYCGQTFSDLSARAKHMLTHTNMTSIMSPGATNIMSPGATNIMSPGATNIMSPGATNIMSPSAGSIPSLPHTPKEVSCHICGGIFDSKQSMEHHMRLHHVSEVFACTFCPSIFSTSSGLSQHMTKDHPSENRHMLLLQMPSMHHQS